MGLLLIKICAIAAVNLVAGGTEGRNVITKSGRTLQLKRDAEHLRTYQSTSDGEEERGFGFAEVAGALEKLHREVLAIPESLDNTLKSALESKIFNDFFVESYNRGMLVDDFYKALKIHEKNFPAAAQYLYLDFVKQKNLNIHSTLYSTLAKSVHPTTAAESVHPTVADPVSTRSKDKGPAEVDGGQLSSEVSSDQDQYSVWLQYGTHPIKVLKLLELDEIGDTFLEDLRMFKWTSYVTNYNHKYSEKSTTVFDALKEGGVKEETMVNMVFSWDKRRESVTNKVDMLSSSDIKKKKIKNYLHSCQEIARTDILNGLRKSWLSRNLLPLDVLDILGLLPNLETGFDVSRFAEWLKYLEIWIRKQNRLTIESRPYPIALFLSGKGYTSELLKRFLPFLEDKNSLLSEQLKEWINVKKWTQKMKQPQKRKRDTS